MEQNEQPVCEVNGEDELIALLEEAIPFLTFFRGSAYVSVAYEVKQDALRKKIRAVIEQRKQQ